MAESAGRGESIHSTILRLIDERPALERLEVGYHLRNQAEESDIVNLLQESGGRLYAGLAGSRKVGKVFFSDRRLDDKCLGVIPLDVLEELRKSLPTMVRNIDGRDPLPMPALQRCFTRVIPANEFFYDIDLVVVPESPDIEYSWRRHVGKSSGTPIDVFTFSHKIMQSLKGSHGETFMSSLRLPYK